MRAARTFVHTTPNTDLTFAATATANGLTVAVGHTQAVFPGQTQSGRADVFIKQFLPPNNAPTFTATLSASSGTVLKTGPPHGPGPPPPSKALRPKRSPSPPTTAAAASQR